MKKLLAFLFLIICQYSVGQITLTPNSVGMNSPTENNVLTAQGNGLVVQKKFKLTTENPNLNVLNVSCPSIPTTSLLAGIIKDPHGDLPYIGGVTYNCSQTVLPFPQPTNIIGFKLTFSVFDLGVGDTVFVYSGGTQKFSGTTIPAPIFLSKTASGAGVGFSIQFSTNTDSNVGQGFVVKYEAIFEDTQGSTSITNAIGDNSLVFDTQKGSLSAGILQNQTERGIFSVGLGYYPVNRGAHSVSIGKYNSTNGLESVALGSDNVSSGNFSYTSGTSNNATKNYSIAIGTQNQSTDEYCTALGNANIVSKIGSFAVGNSNENIGHSSFASGMGLVSKSYLGSVVGVYNSVTDTPDPNVRSSTDRVFQIGIGENTFIRNNALTILRNGNIGIGSTALALAPDSRLVIDGFTRLGNDAPKVKMKEISGNMPALNANNSYPHGLTDSKILSITISAEVNNQFIPPSYTGNSSLEYNYYWTAGSLYILNKNGNSAGLAGVPFKAVITYKE